MKDMRKVLWISYGPAKDSLRLATVPQPQLNSPEDVLIRVRASTVFVGDCELRQLAFPFIMRLFARLFFGLTKPKKDIGQEISGEIVEIGANVQMFKVGDAVFGSTVAQFGAHAEYVVVPGDNTKDIIRGLITQKPHNITHTEAAGAPLGASEALYFIKKGELKPNQHILIIGAAGDIGSFAIQLAKLEGCIVTGVDCGEKLDAMKALGADYVIDYTITDYTKDAKRYDVIFDVLGKGSLSGCRRILTTNGKYLVGNFGNWSFSHVCFGWFQSLFSSKKVMYGTAAHNAEVYEEIAKLLESGKVRSVIDRVYPLNEIVAAHEYVESGKKIGSVAISLD